MTPEVNNVSLENVMQEAPLGSLVGPLVGSLVGSLGS